MITPVTYNDKVVDERARKLYMKILDKIEEEVGGEDKTRYNPDWLHALAAAADATASGFAPKDDDEPKY